MFGLVKVIFNSSKMYKLGALPPAVAGGRAFHLYPFAHSNVQKDTYAVNRLLAERCLPWMVNQLTITNARAVSTRTSLHVPLPFRTIV